MSDKGKIEIIYDTNHWRLFHRLRKQAAGIMGALSSQNLNPAIYGSAARGDVNINSDIDILIPYAVSSHSVEVALSMNEFNIYSRKIVQATPNHAIKAHIFLDLTENQSVTFPLVPFRPLELEFYKFGGVLGLEGVKSDERVSGCDKKLKLIEPTSRGHFESPIRNREFEVAKTIGVNVAIVNERVRVLTRRSKVGRTGIMLSRALQRDEAFEQVLKELIDSNPIVRRKYTSR